MPDRIDDLYSPKWFSDLERSIELLEKQEAAIKATNESLKSVSGEVKGAKSLEDLAAAQQKVAATSAQAAAGFDDFNTAIKQAEALKAKYNGSTKEMVDITLSSARATKELAQAARLQQAAAKDTEKATRAEKKALDELTNEYGILSKAYNEAALRAKNYSLTLGATHTSTVTAIADAKKLADTLKALDASVGQNQRSVGDYTIATRGLRGSMQQIVRELPSISNGFATFASAIGNNIAPAAEAIANFRQEQKLLKAEGKPTQSVFQALGASVLNFSTLLLVGVTILTVYGKEIGEFAKSLLSASKGLSAAAAAAQALNEAFKSTQLKEAITQINDLREYVKLAKEGFIDKERVVKMYNETIGKTMGQLTDLNDIERKLVEAGPAYLRMTLLKAAAETARAKMAESMVKSAVAQKDIEEEAESSAKGLMVNPFNAMQAAFSGLMISYDKFQEKAAKKNETTFNSVANDLLAQAAKIADLNKFDILSGDDPKPGKSPKGPKSPKAAKAQKLKEEKDHTADMLKELAEQSENEAKYQKLIADDINESLEDRLVAFDNYTQNLLNAIGLRGVAEKKSEATIQSEIKAATKKAYQDRGKMEEEEQKRIQKNLASIKTGGATEDESDRKKKEDKARKDREQYARYSMETLQSLADIERNASDARIASINREIEAINKKRDADIEAINGSLLAEDEKKRKIAEINARAAAKEQELANKAKQEKRKQAELNKAFAIAQIILNTAMAVTAQLAVPGAGIGLAIAAGVAGAAQLAAAIAAPIPEFRVGTENSPEGPAVVHKGEMVIPRSGPASYVEQDTLTYLKKGTVVKTAQATEEMMKYYALGMPELRQGNNDRTAEVLGGLKENAQIIAGAIKDKRFPSQQAKPGWWDKYEYIHTR